MGFIFYKKLSKTKLAVLPCLNMAANAMGKHPSAGIARFIF
jgi:hypothetical protein